MFVHVLSMFATICALGAHQNLMELAVVRDFYVRVPLTHYGKGFASLGLHYLNEGVIVYQLRCVARLGLALLRVLLWASTHLVEVKSRSTVHLYEASLAQGVPAGQEHRLSIQ